MNLDFENAVIVPDPASPYFPAAVYASNAIPGWVAYIAGNPQVDIFHNTVSLGAAWISIHDQASSRQPIQGNYSMMLQPSFAGGQDSVALGQIGQIPTTAKSLLFYGSPSMQVTFEGQAISLIGLSSTPQYFVLGADISMFSGQTGELKFLEPVPPFAGVMVWLDNIQFSDQPIPEPSVFGLFALGALLLGWRLVRARQ